jgi:peroxiredoxin
MLSLAAAVVAMGVLSGPAMALEAPEVGETAPSFTLKDVNGSTHSLKDFRGDIVVLHFQQISCPWEANYQPYLNKVAKQYKGKDVQFLAINSNKTESAEKLRKFQNGEMKGDLRWAHPPVAYPVLKDPGNKVADKYAAKTTPHMYIIDKEGTLRYRGGIEKAPAAPSEVTKSDEQYLEPTLDALINGSEVPHQVTKSKGCGIKRE